MKARIINYLKMGVLVLLSQQLLAANCFAQTRVISIDAQSEAGQFNTFYKTSIGAGRANEGLRADWQQQLAEIKRDADFKYIRMHGLLSDDMGVYRIDQHGVEQFNFQYIDALYDYILSIDMKPFVELGFMPSSLASGKKTIFWWRGNVTPPYSYDRWENLIKTLVQHWTERYGEEEVKTWYFEVWNEPNLGGFWAGTQDEYFKLYRYSAKAVKSVNNEYRVGGPATAGGAWIPETISYCEQNNVSLDFVSSHAYGVNQGFLDEFGTTGTVLAPQEYAVSADVLRNRKEISSSPKPNLELHYTEWSSSYTPADPIHDSYHQAAYILQKLKQVGNAVQSMSYWVFTDIFEEAGPRFEAFHGGFGLMNTQGIKKPAYFAYQFLNKLGDKALNNSDTMSFATSNENGSVQLLVWDFTHTLPDNINNQQYYIHDLPAKEKGELAIEINGLKKGKYTLRVSQVGYRQNDAYTAYIDMKSPSQLSKNQVEKLKAIGSGAPLKTEKIRIGKSGKFSTKLPMRENDVYLIEIIKR